MSSRSGRRESCCNGRCVAGGSRRAFFVEPDDLVEVPGGEAVGATDTGVRNEATFGAVLHPPGGTAEGFGDLLGAVEAGQ